jgi:hypothetical protein
MKHFIKADPGFTLLLAFEGGQEEFRVTHSEPIIGWRFIRNVDGAIPVTVSGAEVAADVHDDFEMAIVMPDGRVSRSYKVETRCGEDSFYQNVEAWLADINDTSAQRYGNKPLLKSA